MDATAALARALGSRSLDADEAWVPLAHWTLDEGPARPCRDHALVVIAAFERRDVTRR